LEQKIKMI